MVWINKSPRKVEPSFMVLLSNDFSLLPRGGRKFRPVDLSGRQIHSPPIDTHLPGTILFDLAMSRDTSLIDSFPFSSYLNSNYVPCDNEVVQIKAFLAQPRTRLEEMKAKIHRLQAELDFVKSKYDNLNHQINTCASLITLPRRVPDDVLQEIFYQALPTDRNTLPDTNSTPLIFMRVCRQWRQVASSTPRLWSMIHFHTKSRPQVSYRLDDWSVLDELLPERWEKSRVTGASEWLKRSGDVPLHISFVAQWDHCAYPPAVGPYLSLMLPLSSRWKSLVLEGSPASFSRIFTLDAADLRSLELLILDFVPLGYTGSQQELSTTWSNCGLLTSPSLRKLSIRGDVTMEPTNLGVNWAQLTHLELNAMTICMSTASEILQPATQLVSCRFRISGWAKSQIHSMKLPFLRHLSMAIEGDILPFTERLEIPGIRQIKLMVIENNITGTNSDYKNCLAPLFGSQQGRIQKLVIDTRDHESFLEILRKCPDLISLTIKLAHAELYTSNPRETPLITIDDEFLERISSNNRDGEVLCPRLEEFICEYPAAFSRNGMIQFIKRKQDGNIPKLAKLKKVVMLPLTETEMDIDEEKKVLLGELQPYISQGLIVHFPELRNYGFPDSSLGETEGVYGRSAARYVDYWGV